MPLRTILFNNLLNSKQSIDLVHEPFWYILLLHLTINVSFANLVMTLRNCGKQRIMNHFPDMIEVCAGQGTNLMFDEDLSITLSKACKSDSYDDAMHLVRAAQIIRRDTIDNSSKYSFQGTFSLIVKEILFQHLV